MRSRNERSKSTVARPDTQQFVHFLLLDDTDLTSRAPQVQVQRPSSQSQQLSLSQPQPALQSAPLAPLRIRKFSTPTALLERRATGGLPGGGVGVGSSGSGSGAGAPNTLPSRFPIISECDPQSALQSPQGIDDYRDKNTFTSSGAAANAYTDTDANLCTRSFGRQLEYRAAQPSTSSHQVGQHHHIRLVRNSPTTGILTVASGSGPGSTTLGSGHSSSAAAHQHQYQYQSVRFYHRSLSGASSLVDNGSVYVQYTSVCAERRRLHLRADPVPPFILRARFCSHLVDN